MPAILSIYVCLMASPQDCHWETPAQEPVAFIECLLTGQSKGIAWAEQHPKWIFDKRYRCIPGEPGRDI